MGSLQVGRMTVGIALMLLISSIASAQSVIAGLVTDNTGAVLPGVTIEAESPALIEKVRTATTDGQGRYSIPDLRPGMYSVTFTLPGFNGVRRDGISVASDVNVPINLQATRTFKFGPREITTNLQFYNALNTSAILAQNQTWGANLGRPSRTAEPRVIQLSARLRF